MKTKVLILLTASLLILTSCDYFKDKDIEVKNERLSITSSTSFDVDKAQMGGKVIEASVQGEVTNLTKNVIKNLVLTYKFPRERVTAKIKLLKPGQTRKFATSRYKAHRARPSFKLDKVTYDKKKK